MLCHICGKPVFLSPKSFGERVAAEIRPKGGKTRFYCIQCWEQELKLNGYNKKHFNIRKSGDKMVKS